MRKGLSVFASAVPVTLLSLLLAAPAWAQPWNNRWQQPLAWGPPLNTGWQAPPAWGQPWNTGWQPPPAWSPPLNTGWQPPPSSPGLGSVPDLSGTWINRANGGLCRIIQRGGGQALFINEHGSQAWGTIQGNQVWIPDWQDASGRFGLVGRIGRNRIDWPGGNFWYR